MRLCILDKIDRKDYSNFVSQYCKFPAYSPKEIRKMAKEHNIGNKLDVAIRLITVDVILRFEDGDLKLDQAKISQRVDGMSGKIRSIALESIMQQVIEHVVVGCMEELWCKKLCPHQSVVC